MERIPVHGLQPSTTDGQVPITNGGVVEWADPTGGGGGGSGIIAIAEGTTSGTHTTTAGAAATPLNPLNPTELETTVTFPESGELVVTLSAAAAYSSTTVGAYFWCLLNGSDTLIEEVGINGRVAVAGLYEWRTVTIPLIGTPGAVQTIRWGHRSVSGTGTTYTGGGSGTVGNAVMTVAEVGPSAVSESPGVVAIPATALAGTAGSPLIGNVLSSGVGGALLDSSTAESIGGAIELPSDWLTLDIYVDWAPTTTGAGNVRLDYGLSFIDPGEVFTAPADVELPSPCPRLPVSRGR